MFDYVFRTIRASYESNLDQFREDDDETDYIDARKVHILWFDRGSLNPTMSGS